jgi:hypothetical protein
MLKGEKVLKKKCEKKQEFKKMVNLPYKPASF